MLKSKLFKQTFTLLLVILVLYFLAEVLYLQWTVWWYDVVLHLLSGLCAGMAFVFFVTHYDVYDIGKTKKLLNQGIFFVLIIGLLWEIYELKFGLTSFSDGVYYYRDTVSDIVADVCGGLFGILYGVKVAKSKL